MKPNANNKKNLFKNLNMMITYYKCANKKGRIVLRPTIKIINDCLFEQEEFVDRLLDVDVSNGMGKHLVKAQYPYLGTIFIIEGDAVADDKFV